MRPTPFRRGQPRAGETGQGTAADLQQALRITEIFYSLQGEASTVGLPTVLCALPVVRCAVSIATPLTLSAAGS